MEDIVIDTNSTRSVIHCGEGAFQKYAPALGGKSLYVVTDSNVMKLYGGLINTTFKGTPVYVLPAGEKSKNYSRLISILKDMISRGVTRSSTVVAFGGGVVGDIAGLAASLYMRGVSLVQIPTTLLSQVDSSVGGKTAVDLGGVKNVVGAFYQPQEVIVDPVFLKTLPRREIRCGLGEIIKYGAIDEGIFYALQQNSDRLFDLGFLGEITAPCIRHKAEVVRGDERDVNGLRKTLNLGHTTGHAFELYYKRKSHGEFVLIGMYYELYIAVHSGICAGEYAESIRALIKKVIKTVPAYPDAERAALNAKYDKKNERQSEVSIVVPSRVGVSAELKLPLAEYGRLIAECAEVLRKSGDILC